MLGDWTDKITEKERISLNLANCRCCLLGMKDCKTCPFNFALPILETEHKEKVREWRQAWEDQLFLWDEMPSLV